MPISSIFSQWGSPREVLKLENRTSPSFLLPRQVRVAMRLTPLNPADINLIEGTYGIRPSLPAIPGNEGFGEVIEIGSEVKLLKKGDWVRPLTQGTWQQECMGNENEWILFPHQNVSPEFISQLWVNPSTAWRMLHDFVSLQPGDWIIQNASTSCVGLSVIQIAKSLGWKTLSLVRREEDVTKLKSFGADEVFVENATIRDSLKEFKKNYSPQLALNAVGGESASHLAKTLGFSGTLVTYGAMSKQPLSIPNGLLIFHQIQLKGFWITPWQQKASSEIIQSMFHALISLHQTNQLQLPVEKIYPFTELLEAIDHSQRPSRTGKILVEWNPAMS